MLGHGAKFNHKKEQAIAALLSHRNVEEAARAVGISANTLLRWMKEPKFDAAYREARRTASCQSIARLQDALGAAVTTVLKIMLDSKVSAGTRLRAAAVVMAYTAKAIEIEDIDVRVAELERAAGSANRSRKHSAILTVSSMDVLPDRATRPPMISAAPRLPAAPQAEIDNDTDPLRSTTTSGDHLPSALESSCHEPAVPNGSDDC
jgi:transposase-like protein